jgi:hypothetical protein
MPWNFRIFRGNAPGENVNAAPKAQLFLSSGLLQIPVCIGLSDTMSGEHLAKLLSELLQESSQ